MIELTLSWENFKRATLTHALRMLYAQQKTTYQIFAVSDLCQYATKIVLSSSGEKTPEQVDFETNFKEQATSLI